MTTVIKLLPWALILYGLWGGFQIYETKTVENESLMVEISGLETRLVKLKKAKKDIELYYSDIEAAKDRIKKISKEFEFVQKKLPEKQDDKENFDLFKKIADKVLIKKIKFNTSGSKQKSGYIEKTYVVNAKGTYLQFLLFFELLYKYERLFDVRNILLRSGKVQERGRFQTVDAQFDIKTYVYNVLSDKKSIDDSKNEKKK